MHSEQQAPKSDRFVTQIFDLIYFFETFANFAMPLKNMSTVMLLIKFTTLRTKILNLRVVFAQGQLIRFIS